MISFIAIKERSRYTIGQFFYLMALLLSLTFVGVTPALAAVNNSPSVDLLRQSPTEIEVSLGTTANELQFVPDRLELLHSSATSCYSKIPARRSIILLPKILLMESGRKK